MTSLYHSFNHSLINMTRLFYDGTFEGLLTAVFEIYDRRLTHVKMEKGEVYNSALFDDLIKITHR